MRNFRNSINGLPHAEERPQACPRLELGARLEARTTSLLRLLSPDWTNFLTAAFAGATIGAGGRFNYSLLRRECGK
jgi:hypothetical protein